MYLNTQVEHIEQNDSILDDSRQNVMDIDRSQADSTVWNEEKYMYLRQLTKDEKDELAQDAI
jgi:hypothetical protein